jgi:UDP-glucose 4-epimerase
VKAIVTGSNGFIGFNLCRALKEQGYIVLGIDDLSSGRPDNVVSELQYEYLKVQDKARLAAIFRDFEPDTVFHLAAIPRVSYSVENPYRTAEANILGTISILESIVKAGLSGKTRVIFSSSSSVYGGAAQLPTPEDYPCNPKSPYALEKLHGEQWGQLFARLYGLDVVSLRYFNVFGPHALFGGAYSTVLTAWLYHIYVDRGYEAFLEGDGTQTRDFCFVNNVVQANIRAAKSNGRFTGQAFNIAQGASHTIMQCKQMLEEITGVSLNLAQRPPRVGDVKHTLADIALAQKELAYQPATDFVDQLTVMAAWYRDHYPKKAATLLPPLS